MSKLICVGAIAGAYGVRGEIRLKSYCAVPEDIARYGPLFTKDGKTSYQLSIIGTVKNGFSSRVVGVHTKEQADSLKGTALYVSRDKLPDLPDDEFYHSDLIGLDVFDTGGVCIGSVKAMMNNNSDDLLEIILKKGGQTVLIPFSNACVPTVDLTARKVIIDPIAGLLPE